LLGTTSRVTWTAMATWMGTTGACSHLVWRARRSTTRLGVCGPIWMGTVTQTWPTSRRCNAISAMHAESIQPIAALHVRLWSYGPFSPIQFPESACHWLKPANYQQPRPNSLTPPASEPIYSIGRAVPGRPGRPRRPRRSNPPAARATIPTAEDMAMLAPPGCPTTFGQPARPRKPAEKCKEACALQAGRVRMESSGPATAPGLV
jgi:hypothetical protein